MCDVVASAFGKCVYGNAMCLPTGIRSVTECSGFHKMRGIS